MYTHENVSLMPFPVSSVYYVPDAFYPVTTVTSYVIVHGLLRPWRSHPQRYPTRPYPFPTPFTRPQRNRKRLTLLTFHLSLAVSLDPFHVFIDRATGKSTHKCGRARIRSRPYNRPIQTRYYNNIVQARGNRSNAYPVAVDSRDTSTSGDHEAPKPVTVRPPNDNPNRTNLAGRQAIIPNVVAVAVSRRRADQRLN